MDLCEVWLEPRTLRRNGARARFMVISLAGIERLPTRALKLPVVALASPSDTARAGSIGYSTRMR